MIKFLLTFTFFISFLNNFKAQTFWTGPTISFSKPSLANWLLPENQDSITPNVILTRQTDKGLFNIVLESEDQSTPGNSLNSPSPMDTEWAFGTIADGVTNLTFNTFKQTMEGNVGINWDNGPLVLHLITDDIYIDLDFTYWAVSTELGGFSYDRSTEFITSTSEYSNPELKVFPNPSTELIQITGMKTGGNYKIINVLGEIVSESSFQENGLIYIQDLVDGIYFIRLENAKTFKFLKKS